MVPRHPRLKSRIRIEVQLFIDPIQKHKAHSIADCLDLISSIICNPNFVGTCLRSGIFCKKVAEYFVIMQKKM